ncbi:breast cancer type 1 susceptibility protein homolog [Polyodon spathula]|uniref:breast cancer type 1 susceptibility protein homolog n=1 Tax=Polyodon spathula TaxID=7913 RepID=UPI001B7EEE5E|nr:breast cancer type 1 susceptibility protein homolog [Polyodon spathula]
MAIPMCKTNDVKQVLSMIHENLQCPICLDLMKEPVSTKCDHHFCRLCMLNLLSRKKGGLAECPLCKSDVTKRSLQDSPRFKLLVEGLLKTIHGFEQDTGTEFYTGSVLSKKAPEQSSCGELWKSDGTIQSTGYRNRTKKKTASTGMRENNVEGQSTIEDSDTVVRKVSQRNKRQKLESAVPLCIEIDSSEEVLCKKKDSNRAEESGSNQAQANGIKTNVDAKSWERGYDETNYIPSNRQIEFEMVSSTAAEDEFAELMGLEEDSCLTNSGTRQASLTEEMAEVGKYNSAVDIIQQPTAAEQKTDYDPNITAAKTNGFIAASKEENGTLGKRKKKLAESQKYYLDKNEMVTNGKSALKHTEDKEISLQDGESKHEFDSVTTSAKCLRKRISRSIEKVTEWLSTIDEKVLVSGIQDNKDEKRVDLDCHHNAEKCPSDGESISDETEIIAQQALENLVKNDRRSQVDKVFGKTYRRDKKLSAQIRKSVSTSPKENQGLQEDQKASMRKRSSELTPVDLIKKPRCEDKSPNKTQEKESFYVHQTENHNIISDAVSGDDSGGRSSNDQPLRKIVRAEKTDVKHSLNDLRNDLQRDFQENGEKYVKKSNKRKSRKRSSTTSRKSTKAAKSLALVSCQLIQNLDQSAENGGPSNLTDIHIDSYPSSEDQAVAETRVTRRSRRLQLAVDEVIRDKKRCRKPSANKSEKDVCVEKISDSVNVEKNRFESEKDLQRLEATSPRLQDLEDNPAPEATVVASNNQDTGEPNMSEIRLVNEKPEVCNENQVVEESSLLSMVPNTESDPSFLQNSQKNKPFLQPSAFQMPPACDQPTEAEENFHNRLLTETEDSELDTELLMKTFKTTKRKSFNLLPSPVTKEDDVSFPNEGLENKLDDSNKLNFIANSVCSKGAEIKPDTPGEPKPCGLEDSGTSERICSDFIPPTDPDSAGNAAVRPQKAFLKCREAITETSSTVCNNEENLSQNACYDSLHRDQSSKALKGKETALTEEILPRKGCSMSPSPSSNSDSLPSSALLFPALSESQNRQEINLLNTNRIVEVHNTKKTAEVCSSNGKAEEQVTEHTVVEPSLQTQKNIPAAEQKECEESSMTPDGLLFHNIVGDDGKVGGVDPSLKAEVAGKSQESLNEYSQTLYRKRRRLQRLESSESESSNEEVLPTFMEFIFGSKPDPQSNHKNLPVLPPQTSLMQNLPQPYGSVEKQDGAAGSNAEECIVADLSYQLACPSSQESVDLFGTQSDFSEHSLTQQKGSSPKTVSQNSHSLSGETLSGCCNEKRQDTEELLEVAHGFEHVSHNGESPALSSESEILTTQQKDTMQTNLNHLEREMAVLQAVLEQQETQESEEPPCQGKGQYGEKDHLDSHQATSCSQGEDQNTACARSPVPPSTPSDSQLRLKRTPMQVKAAINLLSKLNAANPSQEAKADVAGDGKRNWEEKKTGDDTSGHFNQKEPNIPQRIEKKVGGLSGRKGAIKNSSSPAACSTLRAGETPAPISAVSHSRLTPGVEDPSGPSGNRKRSLLKVPTPLESCANMGAKRPVLRRKMSFVASGLNKSELMLVQEFAKKIQVTLSSQVTPGTTHIIMKTDSELVCERTLKYFLGIAGRKWVVSFQWIVECFKQRQVLDEAEFEVKGDIINGRNHKGPRRARTTMDGKLLLSDYEICCYGTFTDMSKGQLEWMVELCGATVIKEPCLFTYSPDRSPVVVVQPDSGGKEIDYKALQRQYSASVVTREWILDSVACYICHSLDSYLAEPLH